MKMGFPFCSGHFQAVMVSKTIPWGDQRPAELNFIATNFQDKRNFQLKCSEICQLVRIYIIFM